MFSLFKKKPIITEQPISTQETIIEPVEINYPENVKLIKDKINRLKWKVKRNTDKWWNDSYSIWEIEFSYIWYGYISHNLAIMLSSTDRKEIMEYLRARYEKQVDKEIKKKERETLKYLKS